MFCSRATETVYIISYPLLYLFYWAAYTEGGGCLDGKQHLSIQGLAGNPGMQSLAGAIGKTAASGSDGNKPKKGTKNKTRNANSQEARLWQAVFIDTQDKNVCLCRVIFSGWLGCVMTLMLVIQAYSGIPK